MTPQTWEGILKISPWPPGGRRRAILGMNLELPFPLLRRHHAFRPPPRLRQGGAALVGGK